MGGAGRKEEEVEQQEEERDAFKCSQHVVNRTHQPELLAGKRYSEDVDTYSLGIVMFEIAMRTWPYTDEILKFKKSGGKGINRSMMQKISLGYLEPELDDRVCKGYGVGGAFKKRESEGYR